MDGDGGGYITIVPRWPDRELFFGGMGLCLKFHYAAMALSCLGGYCVAAGAIPFWLLFW